MNVSQSLLHAVKTTKFTISEGEPFPGIAQTNLHLIGFYV